MQAPLGSDGLWTTWTRPGHSAVRMSLVQWVHQLLEADERLAKRAPPAEPT
jgi:hypothetical protein